MGRYFRRGVSKMLFALEIADKTSVASSELGDAVDLSEDIAEINGFELSNDPISTPNLADQFTPQIDGEDSVAASSLTLYDRDDDEVKRLALEKGTSGYLLLAPYGTETGKRVEVWPVKSNGVNDSWGVGNEAARFNVPFSIREVPEQNAEIAGA